MWLVVEKSRHCAAEEALPDVLFFEEVPTTASRVALSSFIVLGSPKAREKGYASTLRSICSDYCYGAENWVAFAVSTSRRSGQNGNYSVGRQLKGAAVFMKRKSWPV